MGRYIICYDEGLREQAEKLKSKLFNGEETEDNWARLSEVRKHKLAKNWNQGCSDAWYVSGTPNEKSIYEATEVLYLQKTDSAPEGFCTRLIKYAPFPQPEIVIDEKAMILSEDVNISITRDGYIKRISNRSIKASEKTPFGKKENDYLVSMYKANTLDHLLLFSDAGNYLFIPVHKIEEFKWKDPGKHVSYLVKMDSSEKIIASILVKDFNLPLYVMIATKNGQIKRTLLKDFEVTRYSKPLKCIGLKNDDKVVDVKLTNNDQGIILTTKNGYGALYSEQEVSIVGIKALGIKAINLKDDELVSLGTFDPMVDHSLVLISDSGGIKRIKISDIKPCNRATKGVMLFKNLKTKTTYVKKALIVDNNQQIMITLNDQTVVEFKANDYHNMSLEQKFSSLVKLNKDQYIDDIYIDKCISTNDYTTLKTTLNVEKVSDDQSLITKKNKSLKYEKISLEDILNDGEF